MAVLTLAFLAVLAQADILEDSDSESAKASEAVPWSQIGAKAEANYEGDGLSVLPKENGASLRCVFQRLEGEATPEGLWLTSTAGGAKDTFRVLASAIGRATKGRAAESAERAAAQSEQITGSGWMFDASPVRLGSTGAVTVSGKIVSFSRPGLVEEYTVSMDGVRQDFVVLQRPEGAGELRLELTVVGAAVETTPYGARLVLESSSRKIAYSRLHVVDATGRELPARIEVCAVGNEVTSPNLFQISLGLDDALSLLTPSPPAASPSLAVLVNDADAAYPIRIDPIFSDENWVSMGGIPGTDGVVGAVAVDEAGDVYIGGQFKVVGDVLANRIAKWNGNGWSLLGLGVNSTVYALAVSGNDLYAGGSFTIATNGGGAAIRVNRVAKWNGTDWSALGSGLNSSVYALAVSASDLYAGGLFTRATNTDGTVITANCVAKWNGTDWSALGAGMIGFNSSVQALALSGSDLYAGGGFTNAGGAAKFIAKWDGISWTPLGSGMNAQVRGLAVSGGDLYAVGHFSLAGGVAVNGVAKWDGNMWSSLGASGSFHFAIAVSGTDIYVASSIVKKWNGSNWTSVGAGLNHNAYALAAAGSNVYAGGEFTAAGGKSANYIAKWGGTNWSAMGSGINAPVKALVTMGDDLFVGGDFAVVGTNVANRIAKWNGTSWSALGSGLNDTVYALAVSGSNLYLGGEFTTAGGISANCVAKWNGNGWSALGSGMSGSGLFLYVRALAVSGSNLYAGGQFAMAGGNPAYRIAKWDGDRWSALGLGLSGSVWALLPIGNDLYAAGSFTTATNIGPVRVTVNRVAKWNGTNWSSLGSGMNFEVLALASSGNNLYAGGAFTTAGGNPAKNVAKWDGNAWSAIGLGMNSNVFALIISGDDVYAGGDFTEAGGNAANYIARWNGTSWSGLGLGMNGNVSALTTLDGDLYAAGNFTLVAGKVSAHLARADVSAFTPPRLGYAKLGNQLSLSWPVGLSNAVLESSPTFSAGAYWTNVPSSGNSASLPIGPGNQFFRLRIP